MNATSFIVGITAMVMVAAVAIWGFSGVSAPLPLSPDLFATPTTTTEQATTTVIALALLDTAGITQGKARGCDRVVLVPREIVATSSILNAALRELFAEEREQVLGAFNFVARTNDTLWFEHATTEEGVARIYLTGHLSGLAGVCDEPRTQIQIEETALQFPSVERVDIYLNGIKTTLAPSQH